MTPWAVLFLLSPAPGAALRFLERRALAGETVPTSLLISEPAPPHGFRALFSPETGREVLTPLGKQLSAAFPRSITLLWQETAPERAWGYTIWEAGEEKEAVSFPLPKPSLLHRFLTRLPGSSAVSPPLHWARQRGLPIDRLPEIGRHAVLVKEYRTVSTLDQRSLLVENAPCLYLFEVVAPPPGNRGE